jgi:outer membrane protein assembly factor BamB
MFRCVGETVVGQMPPMSQPIRAFIFILTLACSRLDAQSPVKLWEFPTPPLVYGIFTSPALGADGTIYYGSGGTLHAINTNGTQKWQFSRGGVAVSSPAIATDGTIYCMSWSGTPNVGPLTNTLYALTSAGNEKWHTSGLLETSLPAYQMALGRDGTIYTGNGQRVIVARRPEDGRIKWSFETSSVVGCGTVTSFAIGPDDTLYFGADTGSVCSHQEFFALTPKGTVKWRTELNVDCGPPAIGQDGTVYVGVRNGFKKFFALNQTNGAMLWTFQTTNNTISINGSPVIDQDNMIYVGASDGYLYALTNWSNIKWLFNAGSSIDSGAVVSSSGSIYFGAGSNFFALSSSGSKQWQYPLTNSVLPSTPLLSAGGVLYFATESGLIALQVESGPAYSPWPMLGHDLRRSCRTTAFQGTTPVFDYYRTVTNGFELTLIGELTRSYGIFGSTNLQDWSFLTNLSSANGTLYSSDLNSGLSNRFYKVSFP